MSRAEKRLIQPGKGEFTIVSAYNKDKEGVQIFSKSSNKPMIKIALILHDEGGNETICYEYLTDAAVFRMQQLCEAIGRIDLITSVEDFNVYELVGKNGKCIIKTECSIGYEPCSRVAKYLKAEATSSSKASESKTFLDDDMSLPF